ncbi:hypothetical protein [Comamonas sp. NLF-1-9]|uniref:hypothetical protein n=1 Tax=Comamonas sp. NLF-1-9 TaxID=2853163 RepID=UPI001C491D68|nr:hypothetical protein [Comamonas sp. NLF-1-9]QXL84725.1 hypothetical protein KUD94_01640 [Comamonas sp. NLF-1-9]
MPERFVRPLAQATGFIAGALLGYALARELGIDLLLDPYGTRAIVAIAAVGLGGGIGIGAARHWCDGHGHAERPDPRTED